MLQYLSLWNLVVYEKVFIFWKIQVKLIFILIKPINDKKQVFTDFKPNAFILAFRFMHKATSINIKSTIKNTLL